MMCGPCYLLLFTKHFPGLLHFTVGGLDHSYYGCVNGSQ